MNSAGVWRRKKEFAIGPGRSKASWRISVSTRRACRRCRATGYCAAGVTAGRSGCRWHAYSAGLLHMDLCLIRPVARLNMHAGVSECHQRRDGCVLARPRVHARVNLGERVQCVFGKLNTPTEKGLRVCPFMYQRMSFIQ